MDFESARRFVETFQVSTIDDLKAFCTDAAEIIEATRFSSLVTEMVKTKQEWEGMSSKFGGPAEATVKSDLSIFVRSLHSELRI